MMAFASGDWAVSEFGAVLKVLYGPFKSTMGEDTYLVEDAEGIATSAPADWLRSRERFDSRHAAVMGVLSQSDPTVQKAELATMILYALDELPAESSPGDRFRDSDGDVWERQSDGQFELVQVKHQDDAGLVGSKRALPTLEEDYGPLERVA